MGIGFWVVCFTMSHLARMLEKKIGVYDLESYRPEACRDEFMLLPKKQVAGEAKASPLVCSPPDKR